MAAGVKTAAIVNYEKYVTHPVTPAPLKLEAKSKAKFGTKAGTKSASRQASLHHAATKPAPIAKNSVATNAVVKNAAAKNIVAPHPASPPRVTASSSAAVSGQKKPSAGIPKETPQN
jgi:hypothetical protein